MSNKRILSLFGKPILESNIYSFGSTLEDNQTDPNRIRVSFIPDVGTITYETFCIGKSINGPITDGQSISPNYTFELGKIYQISINLSIILSLDEFQSLSQKNLIINCGVRQLSQINNTIVICGIQTNTLFNEDGIDGIIINDDITYNIINNKLVITITPSYLDTNRHINIMNIFAEIIVKSFSFLS
jgi:hypothetical protein